jgi:hypothetical protein
MKIKWSEKVTNEEVLARTEGHVTLINIVWSKTGDF